MRVRLNDLLFALSTALDYVEREFFGITTNHGRRVGWLSLRLCQALGVSEAASFDMACCAVLHDNALTAYALTQDADRLARLEHIARHCELGERNVKDFPFLDDIRGIILNHHENWDGSGYYGLAGDDIPLRAAVLRLADNMDLALRLCEPRASLRDEIVEHLRALDGHVYSPQVSEAMLSILDEELLSSFSHENITARLHAAIPAETYNMNERQLLGFCRVFAAIIDAKSHFTRTHSQGVAEKIARMTQHYRFPPETGEKLLIAAYLHDVGKLSTPLSILEKHGKLSWEEFAVIREHVSITRQILGQIHGLEEVARLGGSHHEKLDGTGYPDGARDDALSFEARLLCCCDIYQALTEDRPYRAGMRPAEAIGVMNGMAGKNEIDGSIVAGMAEVFASGV